MKHVAILFCALLVPCGAIGSAADTVPVQAAERLPPLKGASEQQARERLERRGFRNVTTQVTSAAVTCPPDGDDGLAPGLVCGSIPSNREEVPLGTPVVLVVQGERSADDPRGTPPKVFGMPLAEAVGVLASHRFTNLEYEFKERPVGQPEVVCRANRICALHAAGSGVMLPDGRWHGDRSPGRGDVLRITVGTAFPGRRLEGEMINIVGDTLETALQKLDEVGVRGGIVKARRACPPTAAVTPSGRICDQRPAAGSPSSGLRVEYVIAEASR